MQTIPISIQQGGQSVPLSMSGGGAALDLTPEQVRVIEGISPTVDVTDITGGHRVTITDVDGVHSFDVMDGNPGDPGARGPGVEVSVVGTGIVFTNIAGGGN